MTAQRVLADLLNVLAGIPEDSANYRSLREATALARNLEKQLGVKP